MATDEPQAEADTSAQGGADTPKSEPRSADAGTQKPQSKDGLTFDLIIADRDTARKERDKARSEARDKDKALADATAENTTLKGEIARLQKGQRERDFLDGMSPSFPGASRKQLTYTLRGLVEDKVVNVEAENLEEEVKKAIEEAKKVDANLGKQPVRPTAPNGGAVTPGPSKRSFSGTSQSKLVR